MQHHSMINGKEMLLCSSLSRKSVVRATLNIYEDGTNMFDAYDLSLP